MSWHPGHRIYLYFTYLCVFFLISYVDGVNNCCKNYKIENERIVKLRWNFEVNFLMNHFFLP